MKCKNLILDLNERQVWIDSIRGFAILLIILGHWTTQISYFQTSLFVDIIKSFSIFFSPIRLELLFFLSGMVVCLSYRKGIRKYFIGKLENIIWPYIVWSLIMFFLLSVADIFSDRSLYIERLLDILLGFMDLTWFLYFIFIYYVVIVFLKKINTYFVVLILTFLSFYLSNFNFFIDKPSLKISDLLYYLIFFVLGDFFSSRKISFNYDFIFIYLFLFICGISFIWLGVFYFGFNKTSVFFIIPVLMILPFTFIKMNDYNKSKRFVFSKKLINYVGKNSLFFYLVHYPLLLVMSFILKILDMQNIFCYFVILLVCLFFPVFFIKYKEHNYIKWLFTLRFFR